MSDAEIVHLPIEALRYGPNVRAQRVDLDHVRRLREVLDFCPPILVRKRLGDVYEVVDGQHRWEAHKDEKRATIRSVVVDLTPDEALEAAAKANVTHGLPLSGNERSAVAKRMVKQTDWSNARIAAACGVSRNTVADLRPTCSESRLDTRAGRDGKRRPAPAEAAERRQEAARVIREKPSDSDRSVADRTGLSPSTVADVRRRSERGDDPVPPRLASVPERAPEVAVDDVIAAWPSRGQWQHDDTFRTSNGARDFARFMDRHAVTVAEGNDAAAIARTCPAPGRRPAAAAAEANAAFWTALARSLANPSTLRTVEEA